MIEPWLVLADVRGIASLTSFVLYTLIILGVAGISHRFLSGRQFASEYYLGSRGFGPIAFTLTFGATSASAGSFAGFPALIYTHGWVLGLWIAGYALVPITAMGLLGRRLNRISRSCGAITLPDVLRERYGSKVALLATMLIVFLLSFYLIPQFKIASLILDQLLADVPAFISLTSSINRVPGLETADGTYLVCLLMFSVLVVFYTTFGGFRGRLDRCGARDRDGRRRVGPAGTYAFSGRRARQCHTEARGNDASQTRHGPYCPNNARGCNRNSKDDVVRHRNARPATPITQNELQRKSERHDPRDRGESR